MRSLDARPRALRWIGVVFGVSIVGALAALGCGDDSPSPEPASALGGLYPALVEWCEGAVEAGADAAAVPACAALDAGAK